MNTLDVSRTRAGPGAAYAPLPAPAVGVRVRVRSCRFGMLDVPGDRVVRFARPVVGFQDIERYALVEDEENTPVLWMQALGAPELLLPVVDAFLVTDDYSVELSDEEVRVLGLERPEDARLLLVWASRVVLAEALGMLGIPAPEAM